MVETKGGSYMLVLCDSNFIWMVWHLYVIFIYQVINNIVNSSSTGKICMKQILKLLWKMVENMFFLDSEHLGMRGNPPAAPPPKKKKKLIFTFNWGEASSCEENSSKSPPCPKHIPAYLLLNILSSLIILTD